jgi:hypothetical protein
MLALEWMVDDKANCLKYVRKVAYTEMPTKVADLSADQ